MVIKDLYPVVRQRGSETDERLRQNGRWLLKSLPIERIMTTRLLGPKKAASLFRNGRPIVFGLIVRSEENFIIMT